MPTGLAQKYKCYISFKHHYSATSSPAGIRTLARVHLMRRAEDVHRSCPEHFFREPGDVEDEADAADHKREKYLTKFFLKKEEKARCWSIKFFDSSKRPKFLHRSHFHRLVDPQQATCFEGLVCTRNLSSFRNFLPCKENT